jgi:GNAT superfamily N-acetyltransferase
MTQVFYDHAVIRSLLDRFVAADPVSGTMFGTLGPMLSASAWAGLDGDRLAVRTGAEWPVVLSGDWTDVDALRAVAGLRGLNGRPDVVEPLVAKLHDGRRVQRMAQGLYRLEELISPTGVLGTAVRADTEHRDIAREWFNLFSVKTFEHDDRDMAQVADRAISEGLWLWLDPIGEPVSCAARRPVAGGCARIGPIYTPRERRGRGYGSAATATATADVLADGALPVLFTDLANQTTNKIYRAIGYGFVEERLVATFD